MCRIGVNVGQPKKRGRPPKGSKGKDDKRKVRVRKTFVYHEDGSLSEKRTYFLDPSRVHKDQQLARRKATSKKNRERPINRKREAFNAEPYRVKTMADFLQEQMNHMSAEEQEERKTFLIRQREAGRKQQRALTRFNQLTKTGEWRDLDPKEWKKIQRDAIGSGAYLQADQKFDHVQIGAGGTFKMDMRKLTKQNNKKGPSFQLNLTDIKKQQEKQKQEERKRKSGAVSRGTTRTKNKGKAVRQRKEPAPARPKKKKRRRGTPRMQLNAMLKDALDTSAVWRYRAFRHHVDPTKYPTYLTKVKRPMCLKHIMDRCKNRAKGANYPSLDAFEKDVQQIAINSELFNGANNDFTRTAKVIVQKVKMTLQPNRQELEDVSKEIALEEEPSAGDGLASASASASLSAAALAVPGSFMRSFAIEPAAAADDMMIAAGEDEIEVGSDDMADLMEDDDDEL